MTIRSVTSRSIRGLLVVVVAALGVAPASAQIPFDQKPVEFEGSGIVDRRGEQVPLDLTLTHHGGQTMRLDEIFAEGRPVILTLNYYRCPQLCTLILNGLVDGLNDMDLEPAKDFRLVTVSFDPREDHELAAHKRRAYLTQYTREGAAEGWDFFTGNQQQIDTLLDSVGFGVNFDEKTGQYAHPSTIIFLTPDGVISLYMDDVMFAAKDLRLALVEASEGRIGSPLDQFALFTCFQYDPESNSYKVAAWKIMRSGGMLTLMGIVTLLVVLWMKGHSRSGGNGGFPGNIERPAVSGAGGSK